MEPGRGVRRITEDPNCSARGAVLMAQPVRAKAVLTGKLLVGGTSFLLAGFRLNPSFSHEIFTQPQSVLSKAVISHGRGYSSTGFALKNSML